MVQVIAMASVSLKGYATPPRLGLGLDCRNQLGAAGRSEMPPATTPVAIRPLTASPETTARWISIGAAAAMIAAESGISPWLVIARAVASTWPSSCRFAVSSQGPPQ